MSWTDNPVRDFDRWDREQTDRLNSLPKCDICGEPIQDEYMYEIGGDRYCESCMNDLFRKAVS